MQDICVVPHLQPFLGTVVCPDVQAMKQSQKEA